jgi:diguanylate cyclase (GGDEF)-like protein
MLSTRLARLLPSELHANEYKTLLSPHRHSLLLTQRRATMIINRVRLFAFLFAVLTPLWAIVDLAVFSHPLWLGLATFRLLAAAAFACMLMSYRPGGDLFAAYRAIALLFAIPTVFYIASHILLGGYQLTPLAAVVASGYAFMPFVLMAVVAIFPLTLIEAAVVVFTMLVAQALAGYLEWAMLSWPSFVGGFWLLFLIAGVATLACLSQLAFMIALFRQAVRDPLTGVFSRSSGQEILQLQWDTSRRNDNGLAVAFIDLDFFKSISDTYGREVGDQALRDFTGYMLGSLRNTDTLLRWGGDEFVVIMPDADREQACLALRRILRHGLGTRPDGALLTASIGLSERCADFAESPRQLLELAEQRMRWAKRAGRNRLCFGSDAEAGHGVPVSEPPKTHA